MTRKHQPLKCNTLADAIKIVRGSLGALEDLARILNGKVRPTTRKAFRMVLDAAQRSRVEPEFDMLINSLERAECSLGTYREFHSQVVFALDEYKRAIECTTSAPTNRSRRSRM